VRGAKTNKDRADVKVGFVMRCFFMHEDGAIDGLVKARYTPREDSARESGLAAARLGGRGLGLQRGNR